jgi:V/A-type H+-transporting ATPase subunit K
MLDRKRFRVVLTAAMVLFTAGTQLSLAAAEGGAAAAAGGATGSVAIAMAIVVGVACIGAGIAVGRVGSAALGAATERPELLGRSLILVGLAEGIAIYGLIIAIMLYLKM